MKIIPERKINHCRACTYNRVDSCVHPSFDSVMYISEDERERKFPTLCPLEDVE